MVSRSIYICFCTNFLNNLSTFFNMVRYTVGKITPVQSREVRASDFGPKASFWMNFPKEGSQLTPPHQSEDFKWKDYCPMVFRLVINAYFKSICFFHVAFVSSLC